MKYDIRKAKDVVLQAWARAANEVYKADAYDTKNEEKIELYHFTYSSYYVPFAMEEFNYLEGCSDAAAPGYNGYKDNLIRHYHEAMREELYRYNDVLPEQYKFENSSYRSAEVYVDGVKDASEAFETLYEGHAISYDDEHLKIIRSEADKAR